jgi:quercetin dioxygenase-like cupin family protein
MIAESVLPSYTLVENLAATMGEIAPDSIISRTIFKEKQLKAILFGFDVGQELSEHTSSQTAILQIVQGEATVTAGEDRYELGPGAWLRMEPRLKHSVYAKTPLIMLLLMYGAE